MRSLSPSLAFFTSSSSLLVFTHSFIFSSKSLFNRNISLCIRSEFLCAGVPLWCCSSCDFISFSCKWSRFTYSSLLASYFCHFAFKSSTWKFIRERHEEQEDTKFQAFIGCLSVQDQNSLGDHVNTLIRPLRVGKSLYRRAGDDCADSSWAAFPSPSPKGQY